MALVPHQTQILDPTLVHEDVIDSTPIGILPLIGESQTDLIDSSKLFPTLASTSQRRPSASSSVKPAIALNLGLTYPPRLQSTIVLPPPSTDVSPAESDSKELHHAAPPAVNTRRQVWRSRVQYAALCFSIFLGGWNDSATVSSRLIPGSQTVS